MTQEIQPANDRELVLSRLLDAPRAKIWRCWSEPELITQWWCPKPWTTPIVEIDFRPGGGNHTLMRGPNGEEHDNHGCYLDIVEGRKIVFTDAYGADWMPNAATPFFTAVITFDDEGGKTRYVARARHWSPEARAVHESMGFHQGWGICADQLEALAKTL